MAVREGPFTRQLGWIAGATAAGLYQAANQIKNTWEELVPIDTGTLKGSGRVLPPELHGDHITCVVGSGYGFSVNPKTGDRAGSYAFPVEYAEDVHHPHGQAHAWRDAAHRHLAALPSDVSVSIQTLKRSGFLRRAFGGAAFVVGEETVGGE